MHKRIWLAVLIVVLVAGHGALFYFISLRVTLTAILSTVVVLVAIKLLLIKRWRLHRSMHSQH